MQATRQWDAVLAGVAVVARAAVTDVGLAAVAVLLVAALGTGRVAAVVLGVLELPSREKVVMTWKLRRVTAKLERNVRDGVKEHTAEQYCVAVS